MNKKRIAVLGSTGSMGRQCLEIINHYSHLLEAEILSAHNNADLLIQQAIMHQPNAVVITDPGGYRKVKEALDAHPVKVYGGDHSLCELLSWPSVDMVFNAIVGFAGLEPTRSALIARKPVALANKESLVSGGALVMEAAFASGTPIIPVDSEHSALFQCLLGEEAQIEKLILTASGGPFLHTPVQELSFVRKEQALAHPVWNMGEKVTIDSASMMNKGLEVIEAHWLFGVPASRIEVLIHPQSVVHSLVQFTDGSIKAQMSYPDMRIPIQFALSFPQRLTMETPRLDLAQRGVLDFFAPDTHKFPCLSLAYHALEQGGNIPCALNAANEVAVAAFLHDQIPFYRIPAIIEETILKINKIQKPSWADIQSTDWEARSLAQKLLPHFAYGYPD
ncbi:MAG: 1-deoxy-D-xylulose-5-phosphate reductoisomerase [Bacteroidetes bacterium]|nr:1-deoxy-D-xylulose-5-phosphate reductoisomerase [Bacteroidota bacterium]